MRQRLLPFLVLLGVPACDHGEPFEPESQGGTTPFQPGPVARLTLDPRPDEWPTWTPDGDLLYTYGANTSDSDRCVGILPPTGGQRVLEWCSNYPGNRDSTDLLSPATVNANDEVAFFIRRQVVGGGRGQVTEALRLGEFTRRPEEARTLLEFPIPGPDGRPIQGLAQLAWLASGRLGFVLEERVLRVLCAGCGYDTLAGGRALATLDPAGPVGAMSLLPGTSLANSFAVNEATGEFWFTTIGDTRVWRTPIVGGPVTEVMDFGALGQVRDIALGEDVLYAIAGGSTFVLDTPNGPMQEDAGGVLYRVPLGSMVPEAITPLDGPFYRRPALSPGGRHVAAQRTGDIWLLESSPP